MVPRREALLGSTLETRNSSSRLPAMASAMTSSASPYISAVSIWVMPSSMPRRSADIAALRSPRSRYQVPCPMTETSAPSLPKLLDCTSELPRDAVQFADVGDQHRAGHRFRDVEPVSSGAADCDIGAGAGSAGSDARDTLAVRREHEDVAERGVRDEQPPSPVHGHAVGTAWTEQRAETADLGDAAVLHERQAPDRIVARHRDEQHGLGGVEHEAVGTDAGVNQTVESAARGQPVNAPGRIMQAGLALVGEIDVAVRSQMQVVAAAKRLGIA